MAQSATYTDGIVYCPTACLLLAHLYVICSPSGPQRGSPLSLVTFEIRFYTFESTHRTPGTKVAQEPALLLVYCLRTSWSSLRHLVLDGALHYVWLRLRYVLLRLRAPAELLELRLHKNLLYCLSTACTPLGHLFGIRSSTRLSITFGYV